MELKQMVGIEAAKYVKDGMVVGLGTGSTAKFMVDEIGRRIKEEGLSIVGVTTSKSTEKQALELGIPLKSIDEVAVVDLTIDGADEISRDFQGIKGGGAALLFEKIVATYSKECIWIVDESKMVEKLGAFPLPVEVMPYGSQQLFCLFEKKGYAPSLRKTANGQTLVTDGGHYIIDLQLDVIEDPRALGAYLDNLVGVVEHGLFLDMVKKVIVGHVDGPETLDSPHNPQLPK
ncbi:ribose-5-phosphate isomerase A [Enterococcus sp. AZ194]|uniref:ribose-5-phosphate isomerase RpiA n=1 Tax=Enterococcus sp. AZ194 TaxID=2774629 RepID=UPI003F1F080A